VQVGPAKVGIHKDDVFSALAEFEGNPAGDDALADTAFTPGDGYDSAR
jgi:hypothetical protein